ncbi:hypothetical protein C5167_007035 [Papaver somniferum]|uniref:Secreted protein n=1 Tax=Papaver somniferum TaxID=3469 RepID=A0A4Y7JF13_PAPSO|nr:hypothetical protein C5167_007035 [Papaver somniferum]
MAKMINIFLKCFFLALIVMTALSQIASAADCQPTTDTYTTDAQSADGAVAASQQYQEFVLKNELLQKDK